MASFKNSIKRLDPKLFLTFDGDSYNEATGGFLGSPEVIMDESGYDNNALLHTSSENLAYRLGLPSLNSFEPSTMHSISFGYFGNYPGTSDEWAKAYLEVAPSVSLATPNDFSISFLLKKTETDHHFYSENGNHNVNYYRPLIYRENVIDIRIKEYLGNQTNTLQIYENEGFMYETNFNPYYDKMLMVTYTRKVEQQFDGSFDVISKFYINAILVATKTHYYATLPPSTEPTDSWFIGGKPVTTPVYPYNDRIVSRTDIDSVQIYDTALSHEDICYVYKKLRTYKDIVNIISPSNYWVLDDFNGEPAKDQRNNTDGIYKNTLDIDFRQDGPPTIPGSTAAYFKENGWVDLYGANRSSLFWNPDGDYTIHFWLKFDQTAQGVVIANHSTKKPYKGMLFRVNYSGYQSSTGFVQFNTSEKEFITSLSGGLNDGKFHSYALIRRGNKIEMWIDGMKQGESLSFTGDVPDSYYNSEKSLMAASPGNFSVIGSLSNLFYKNRALDDAEIGMLNSYSTIYFIRGNITLQGTPYRATVRVYDHYSGELVKEVDSNGDDGSYGIDLNSGKEVDLLILSKNNKNVRYRAFGPIIPSEYEDTR